MECQFIKLDKQKCTRKAKPGNPDRVCWQHIHQVFKNDYDESFQKFIHFCEHFPLKKKVDVEDFFEGFYIIKAHWENSHGRFNGKNFVFDIVMIKIIKGWILETYPEKYAK